MSKIVKMRSSRDLSVRHPVTLELPAFFLAALEHRVREVNDGATPAEAITLEQLVEVELANSLSLADVAHLERELPGISAAVSKWLDEID